MTKGKCEANNKNSNNKAYTSVIIIKIGEKNYRTDVKCDGLREKSRVKKFAHTNKKRKRNYLFICA